MPAFSYPLNNTTKIAMILHKIRHFSRVGRHFHQSRTGYPKGTPFDKAFLYAHKGGADLIVGIQSEILKIHSMGLLDRLLADKTTKTHILWATDAYREQGVEYQRDKEITPALVTGNPALSKTEQEKHWSSNRSAHDSGARCSHRCGFAQR